MCFHSRGVSKTTLSSTTQLAMGAPKSAPTRFQNPHPCRGKLALERPKNPRKTRLDPPQTTCFIEVLLSGSKRGRFWVLICVLSKLKKSFLDGRRNTKCTFIKPILTKVKNLMRVLDGKFRQKSRNLTTCFYIN